MAAERERQRGGGARGLEQLEAQLAGVALDVAIDDERGPRGSRAERPVGATEAPAAAGAINLTGRSNESARWLQRVQGSRQGRDGGDHTIFVVCGIAKPEIARDGR